MRWGAPGQGVDQGGVREVVWEDCRPRGLGMGDAVDRGRWKKLIKIG